jgi:hypothetical protein
VYRKHVFGILEKGVLDNLDKVAVMCYTKVEGFKGFAFVKKVLKGMVNINIPKSCIRIDDDIVNIYMKKNNIKMSTHAYKGNSHPFCSMDQPTTDTHPDWAEININDDRVALLKSCLSDIDIKIDPN